jgi:hypothetical protein
MIYQELYDAFCLAACDFLAYAEKYPSNKDAVRKTLQYFLQELENQEAA